jgi:hypothetical protein
MAPTNKVRTLKLENMHELPPRLIKASQEGKLVLLLGAGASRSIDEDKPDWRFLAENMVDKYEDEKLYPKEVKICRGILDDEYNNDYKKVFSTLEETNKNVFWNILRDNI